MLVKICGLMEPEDVRAAVAAKADYLGFVFAPSKRQVTLQHARQLAKLIPSEIKKVGVFVDAPLTEVLQLIKSVPLDLVQCHGNETNAYLNQIPIPVIKAFSMTNEFDSNSLTNCSATYLLIDKGSGGTGETFHWDDVTIPRHEQKRLFLAGGLTTEILQSANQYFHPFAVDVSSGVETNGKKDPQKIKAFIKKAKEVAINELSSSE
ncbi:phosphoribosylanthranilate isomerase [Carnobacterium gallinarum]|uniref:phosphoribosylanthranilate isomerase n=1 Tax=Carnobacterium gallinarum TaxID=2749 RepID=UPI0005545D01|nr:phosphoribosylanthranilate isomerase [Carnobacterium gallinarum]